MTTPTKEDLETINAIEDRVFSKISLGIDIAELDILDDVNASRNKIQELGVKIATKNPEIAVTILEIARSIYFGHSLQGEVKDFFDAVIRLGSDRVKLLIFSLALFALSKGTEARQRAAKSAGISVLGRIIAEEMNFKSELVRKVETGGLLSQLGRNVLMKARELGVPISDEFIQNYEAYLAKHIIERLQLDPFLITTLDLSAIEFDENSLSLVGIIKLAEAATEDSFRKYGKLVVRSPLPDRNNILVKTPGDDIRKLFAALDLEDLIEIQEAPTKRQMAASAKDEKNLQKKR